MHKTGRQDRGEGNEPEKALGPVRPQGKDIVPVFQNQVIRFVDVPERSRPEEHRPGLPPPVAQKRVPLKATDRRIQNEEISVPGRDIPDDVPDLDILCQRPDAQAEDKDSDDTPPGKCPY